MLKKAELQWKRKCVRHCCRLVFLQQLNCQWRNLRISVSISLQCIIQFSLHCYHLPLFQILFHLLRRPPPPTMTTTTTAPPPPPLPPLTTFLFRPVLFSKTVTSVTATISASAASVKSLTTLIIYGRRMPSSDWRMPSL